VTAYLEFLYLWILQLVKFVDSGNFNEFL
jgi:hypothetical protein